MKQSQFYYLLRRGLFSAGSAIIKSGLVMFNKFTTAGLSFPAQGSADFDGASDFITSDSLPITDFTNFTMSGWFYISQNSVSNHLLGFTNTTTATPIAILESNTNGFIRFNYRTDAGYLTSTDSDSISLNKWYFVTATKEAGNVKIYLDGSLNASDTLSDTAITINTFCVGALIRTTNVNFLDGNLANVAIWNRALSSDEINSVMWKPVQALTATESNGLQAWYSLDDIASPTASLASMEQLATDKDATIENKAAITAAVNSLS